MWGAIGMAVSLFDNILASGLESVRSQKARLSQLVSLEPRDKFPERNAPTERPWAWVICWATCPFLLCLSQTTSRV